MTYLQINTGSHFWSCYILNGLNLVDRGALGSFEFVKVYKVCAVFRALEVF